MERIYKLQIMYYYASKGDCLMVMPNRPEKASNIN